MRLTCYRTFEADKKPVEATFTEKPQIPRKPKKAQPAEANGNGELNGKAVSVEPKGVKRPLAEDSGQPLKKAKLVESGPEVVDVEETGGAIVIDD